jgi:hypothetical protein
MSASITFTPQKIRIGNYLNISVSGTTLDTSNPGKVVVLVNGLYARIVSIDTNKLIVVVPKKSSNGTVKVILKNITYSGVTYTTIESTDILTIAYDDVQFDRTAVASGLFNRGPSKDPIYNKDITIENFSMVTDASSLIQNVYNILLTAPSERLFNAEFGNPLLNDVFALNNLPGENDTVTLNKLKKLIEIQEPRVIVDASKSYAFYDPNSNSMKVLLIILLPAGKSEQVAVSLKALGN